MSADTVILGDQISLVNTSDPVDYLWDFGNGDTSTATNPVVTYADTGTYTICLIASDGCAADTACSTAVVVPPVGIGEHTALNAVRVYPNPTRGNVFVDVSGLTSAATIEVFNALGARQQMLRVPANSVQAVQLESLASGMYLVRVADAAGAKTWRIVVQD